MDVSGLAGSYPSHTFVFPVPAFAVSITDIPQCILSLSVKLTMESDRFLLSRLLPHPTDLQLNRATLLNQTCPPSM